MQQGTDLNRSRLPQRRGQVQPAKSAAAEPDDLNSGLNRKANASTAGGLRTALNAAVRRIEELEQQVAALEATAIQPTTSL